jgi:hypothetical protein
MNTRVITSIEWAFIAFAVEKGVLIAKLAKIRTLDVHVCRLAGSFARKPLQILSSVVQSPNPGPGAG